MVKIPRIRLRFSIFCLRKLVYSSLLLFTTLEIQNHMRSLKSSDGRFYRNELSLDTTNGNTVATRTLVDLKVGEKEQQLLNQWNLIIRETQKTVNYDNQLTYSVYQIADELNTSKKTEEGDTIYDYPELNSQLKTLKSLVKQYYLSEIVPFLFKYEFLK